MHLHHLSSSREYLIHIEHVPEEHQDVVVPLELLDRIRKARGRCDDGVCHETHERVDDELEILVPAHVRQCAEY